MSKIKGINNESATLLMEAMLMECREDFEGGVVAYLDAEKRERKARSRLKRNLSEFIEARNAKYRALTRFAPEYSFLMGKEVVKPMLEGEWVCKHLISQILDGLDDERYAEIADALLSKDSEPIEGTDEELERLGIEISEE